MRHLRERRVGLEIRRVGDLHVVGDDRRDAAEPDMQMGDRHRAAERGRGAGIHEGDEPVPVPQQDHGTTITTIGMPAKIPTCNARRRVIRPPIPP